MRIAMLMSNPFPPEEGIGHYVYNLSKKLIENGHEVTIITRGSIKIKKEDFDGIKIIKFPFIPIYPFHIKIHGFFLNRFFKNLENDFDLIHIHTPLTPILKSSLPIISTLHGSMVENSKNLDFNLKSIANKIITYTVSYPLVSNLIKISDVITTVSDPVSEEIKRYYLIKKIKVIGNAVNEKKFIPIDNKKDDIIKLLYVGRLSSGKGIMDLLNAVNILRIKNYKFQLNIVGSGDMENKIRRFIKKNNLKNHVNLIGSIYKQELIKTYQISTIFTFPSHYEGFPTVVLEAMSCALPVVLSDIPAHKSFIKNHHNGLFFKKGSEKDLCEKLEMLFCNEKLMHELGFNARNTVKEKYTWDKISNEYLKIYEDLLNKK